MTSPCRAVVFGNHDVGVRCLQVLLAGGVDVPLVVTYPDDPREAETFGSLASTARDHGLNVALPQNANEAAFIEQIAALAPHFIFSFYYRQLLGLELLRSASRGALNMHGSMLPKYRGRAPVNWTVVRGETSTGATLHYMTEKADDGDIVDQQAVPILPDDTAFDVFRKVTVAAEIVLWRSLPGLIAGTALRKAQEVAAMTYFGRRRPEDGKIDWSADGKTIHNLVRGVAPPYPGAYAVVRGRQLRLLRTMNEPGRTSRFNRAVLFVDDGRCYVECGGGGVLRVLEADVDGKRVEVSALVAELGSDGVIQLQQEQRVEEGTA
jgi:methionyl-tRNA formyltransferase